MTGQRCLIYLEQGMGLGRSPRLTGAAQPLICLKSQVSKCLCLWDRATHLLSEMRAVSLLGTLVFSSVFSEGTEHIIPKLPLSFDMP